MGKDDSGELALREGARWLNFYRMEDVMLHTLLLSLFVFPLTPQSEQLQFFERSGELEFTGRMIVRPVVGAGELALARMNIYGENIWIPLAV